MKRILLVFSALFLIVLTSNAQFIRFGAKGGVSSSTVKMDRTTFSTLESAQQFVVEQGDSKLGIHFGLFGRIQAFGVFIQPEVLVTQSKGEVILTDVTNSASPVKYFKNQTFNKIDVPIIVGKKFGPARLGLGPVASFMLSEKEGLKSQLAATTEQAVESNFKNATFGYQVGAGLDIFKFATFDVRYEGNLSKLGEGVKIGSRNYNFDQRNSQWIFSLGIFF